MFFLFFHGRIKGLDTDKANRAAQFNQSMDYMLRNKFSTENPVLIGLLDWGQESLAGTEKPEENEVTKIILCSFLF